MKAIQVTCTWNGTKWEVQADGDPPPGTRIELTVPATEAPEKPRKKAGPLLFPRGEYVYFPISPDKNGAEAWTLWENHKAEHRPALSEAPDKALIPIQLEETLRLASADSTGLAPCRCTYDGQSFKSLNQAASAAVKRWTDRETDAVGVFKALCFLHDGQRLRLDLKRAEVIDGTPLPTRDDTDSGTPWLFGEEDVT